MSYLTSLMGKVYVSGEAAHSDQSVDPYVTLFLEEQL